MRQWCGLPAPAKYTNNDQCPVSSVQCPVFSVQCLHGTEMVVLPYTPEYLFSSYKNEDRPLLGYDTIRVVRVLILIIQ